MAAPTLQNDYDISRWMYGFPDSDVLPPVPTGLAPFFYRTGQFDSGLQASGFHGAAFQTPGPVSEIVIGFEGTDTAGIEERPDFLLAQVDADVALYFGGIPQALTDAVAFSRQVIAAAALQGIGTDRITITGHSLGAAEAAYVAAVLGIDGLTFAAPGLSATKLPPSGAGTLVNYVEYLDPVANYSFTPVNYETEFLWSDTIRRVGDPSYIGSPLEEALRGLLSEAGNLFAPNSTLADRVAGLTAFGALAATYHPLTNYGEDLGLLQNNTPILVDGSRIVAGRDYLLLYGDIADRSALVSDAFYTISNPDVRAAGLDAEAHYARFGWREGRDPDAYFSTLGYRAAYADVGRTQVDPLAHYDRVGWREGRDPGANFDTELYLLHNPDVKAAGIDPLAHYLDFGRYEGRAAPDPAIGRPADLSAARGFDAAFYLLDNPDVARAALATTDTLAFARQHYQTVGWREGRDGNAFFDTAAYLTANPDVRAAGIDPLAHYDAFGWREGRDPSSAFDTSAYLARNADVAAAGIDPLLHYLSYGIYEGRTATAGDI
ncbi:hypothetical protein J2X36_004041 [Methylobacterium sp. BE186]|uniref:hypothetical protein n=1 Tax=Methylobacterium sp. BE186 TaxID=2817715 RepID=UPI002855135C|nr:hypothetical protein [Methylobacterium sp. BE186]MDR7039268.1 hypothetical protein [Methylobacterium sp. BE186]